MFTKRSRNLFKKANELASKTGTDIYVLMLRRGRYSTYASTDRPGWPSQADEIVRLPHAIGIYNVDDDYIRRPIIHLQSASVQLTSHLCLVYLIETRTHE